MCVLLFKAKETVKQRMDMQEAFMLMLAEQEGRWQDALTLRAHRAYATSAGPLQRGSSSAKDQLTGVPRCLHMQGCGVLAPVTSGAAASAQLATASTFLDSTSSAGHFVSDNDCMAAMMEMSSWDAMARPSNVCTHFLLLLSLLSVLL
jgi:hypothetical protein